uniref:Uncharacterized protein n=1 Tax=Nelumbo nucifera TaxID=4432 RepID=A0A822ZRX2_NELNU|nr:TPA_asm: hypothetical protein HUJ06_004329 [Nelumbo nucifera]
MKEGRGISYRRTEVQTSNEAAGAAASSLPATFILMKFHGKDNAVAQRLRLKFAEGRGISYRRTEVQTSNEAAGAAASSLPATFILMKFHGRDNAAAQRLRLKFAAPYPNRGCDVHVAQI